MHAMRRYADGETTNLKTGGDATLRKVGSQKPRKNSEAEENWQEQKEKKRGNVDC